ncbi:type II secretion system F family protein [Candidatus Gracilibacteria bacterium]|nr:type II secretion system F family protein [Candidatus Gracilibacteria bacterium]
MAQGLDIKDGAAGGVILNEKSEYEGLGLLKSIDFWFAEHSSVGVKDKVVFFRLLATMVGAGMSLDKSLDVLQDQASSPKLKNIIKKILSMIQDGIEFSTAMTRFPDVFASSEVGLVKAGEKSGKLTVVLKNLADQIESSAQLTGKIKGAIMYPAMMVIVVLFAIVAIMIFVIPEIKKMFESMGAQLPQMTTMLINTSDYLTSKNKLIGLNNTLVLFMYIGLFVMGFIYFKKTKKGEKIYNLFMLRTPLFGSLIRKMVIAKFCRGLTILIGSGMSLINSLYLLSEMVGNEAYRLRILRIISDVKQGLDMSQNMKRDSLYFPPMLVSMIAVGEETAQLEEVSKKVAEFYEEEVDTAVNSLMSLLEPIIIVVVGLVIGGIIVAVMLPILSISDIVK